MSIDRVKLPDDSSNRQAAKGGKAMGIIFGIISAIIAANKGFASIRWVFAFGLIGLIVVSCLPGAKNMAIAEDERSRRAAKADRVGAAMCGWCIGLDVVLFIGMMMVSQ